MLLRRLKIAYGEELEVIDGYLRVKGDLISVVGKGYEVELAKGETSYDCEGLLVIPGFINAHVHLGDSVAKDAGLGLTLNEAVHPIRGLKSSILASTPREVLVSSIRRTLRDILGTGTTSVADFREDGVEGVSSLLEASEDSDVRVITLGRPRAYSKEEDLSDRPLFYPEEGIKEGEEVLSISQGFGLSGPNEYSDGYLRKLGEMARAKGKLVAIHAAESRESQGYSIRKTGKTEVLRAVEELKPNFLVHLTNSLDEDLKVVKERGIPVVCCPRANASMGVGFPKLAKMLRMGITVALGTDNVMVSSPDPFREMEFAWRGSLAIEGSPQAISPAQVLKMMTINGAKVLGMDGKAGSIREGKLADLVFIDLKAPNMESTREPLTALIHRATRDNVKAVMVAGKVAYGGFEDR